MDKQSEEAKLPACTGTVLNQFVHTAELAMLTATERRAQLDLLSLVIKEFAESVRAHVEASDRRNVELDRIAAVATEAAEAASQAADQIGVSVKAIWRFGTVVEEHQGRGAEMAVLDTAMQRFTTALTRTLREG